MPGAGPILLYDKSTLQSLTVDESVWLDTFYFPCMTPLFFIETLADLEKEVQKGRTPEDVVGNLAEKTPLGGAINVHHHTLSINELLGKRFELRNVPVVAGGNPVTTRDGRRGVVFDPPPEAVAMQRWEDRQFLEVERQFAKSWREALSGIDLEELFRQGRDIIKRIGRPKYLEAAKAAAIELLGKRGSRYVTENLRTLKPAGLSEAVLDRWNRFGNPPIFGYAPYTAHVLSVDLFFCIGLGADLIGRERPTNKIDIAYLYYLPFCMAFTSRDKLHGRTAPLFLGAGQEFIHGDDLKADLAKLNAHYSALPDEVKQRGVMSFAHYPPVEGDFLISKLWDKLMRPEWREWARKPMEPKSPEEEAKVLAEVNKIADAPRDAVALPDDHAEPDAMLVQRRVPLRRGSWRMLPPEVEKARSK
jgi:hypothetical protein